MLCVGVRYGVSGVLPPKAQGPLGEFGRILLPDGSSFAVQETLPERYQGRFHKPAARWSGPWRRPTARG